MTTSLSSRSYIGDGATRVFVFDLPKTARRFVKVYLDGVLQELNTDYIWLSDTEVEFITAPLGGFKVLLRRETDTQTLVSNIQTASFLTGDDISDTADQLMHIVQESTDQQARFLQVVDDGSLPDTTLDTSQSGYLKFDKETNTFTNSAIEDIQVDVSEALVGRVTNLEGVTEGHSSELEDLDARVDVLEVNGGGTANVINNTYTTIVGGGGDIETPTPTKGAGNTVVMDGTGFVKDRTGDANIVLADLARTVDLSIANTLNGRAEATAVVNNATYWLYAVMSDDPANTGYVLSVEAAATEFTLQGVLFPFVRKLPLAIKTGDTGNFLPFSCPYWGSRNATIKYLTEFGSATPPTQVISNFVNTAFQAISVNAFVPLEAKTVDVHLDSAGISKATVSSFDDGFIYSSDSYAGGGTIVEDIPLDGSLSVNLKFSDLGEGTSSIRMAVAGYSIEVDAPASMGQGGSSSPAASGLPDEYEVSESFGDTIQWIDAKRQIYREEDPATGYFKSNQFDDIEDRITALENPPPDESSELPEGTSIIDVDVQPAPVLFTDANNSILSTMPKSALGKHPTMKITIVGGQSLSNGTDATLFNPLRTLSTTQTFGNLMFRESLTQNTGTERYTGLAPLIEVPNDSKDGVFDGNGNLINNACGETPCSGYANTYAQNTGISHMMLCTGEGGQRISALTYRTYNGNRILEQVRRAHALLLQKGMDCEVDNILWAHGESDQTQPTKRLPSEYAYDMHSMHKWLEVEIKQITGQTTDINWIMYQTSSNQYYRDGGNTNATTQIIEAYQLAASLYPRMYVSHAMHPLWYVDGVHMCADSSVLMGKYFSRSAESILRTGTWRPMELTAVTRSGNDFLLSYYTPTGDVALNTYLPKAFGGVHLYAADDVTRLNIETSLTIENATTYRLSCSSSAPAGSLLYTGRGDLTGTASAGYHMPDNTRGAGNDLCDSKTDEVYTYQDTASFTGSPRPSTFVMRNYALIEKRVV